ncbi:hypothetical protein [Bythopirellula goksoeyrii]|nr:hypothetical protein [Bythopirellula goksoeyrii]
MKPIQDLRWHSYFAGITLRTGCFSFLLCPLLFVIVLHCSANAAELEQRLPTSSSNAALHYQRAILFLADVDVEKRKLLEKPIWEIVTPETSADELKAIDALLVASRYAIRSALIGAAQANADFGADLSAYSAGTLLPHVGPMQHLAKLVALYGMQQQAEGNWEKSAQLYLDVIRMGQHMGEQLTLAESVEAVRILETGFHALSAWAVHCPDPKLIRQVRSLLSAIAPNPLSPATVIGYEAALVDLRLKELKEAYPDGNWAELMLVVTEGQPDHLDQASVREFVQAEAIKRGVPESVFADETSFDEFIENLRTVNAEYYERMLDGLSLPLGKAIGVGQQIYKEFAPKLMRLGDPETLNPGQISAYYASHAAEHNLADVVLALSANKQGELFPNELSKVASDFGGVLPQGPTGNKVSYKVSPDQKGFRISYPGAKIGEVEIPEIAFDYGGGKGR